MADEGPQPELPAWRSTDGRTDEPGSTAGGPHPIRQPALPVCGLCGPDDCQGHAARPCLCECGRCHSGLPENDGMGLVYYCDALEDERDALRSYATRLAACLTKTTEPLIGEDAEVFRSTREALLQEATRYV